MKTTRPDYMNQSSIQVFQRPRVDSIVIFSIGLGIEVEVLERDIQAVDGRTGSYYRNPIFLHMIRHDDKVGYINRRWLR